MSEESGSGAVRERMRILAWLEAWADNLSDRDAAMTLRLAIGSLERRRHWERDVIDEDAFEAAVKARLEGK